MKVKKYTAASMREALEKMKRDLGTGAVILGSRKISRGGLLDFLGKEMFEVTATTEDNVLVTSAATRGRAASAAAAGSRVSYTVGDSGAVATSEKESFGKVLSRQAPPAIVSKPAPGVKVRSAAGASNVRVLQQDLKDLRSVVGEMAEQMRYQRMPALPPVLREVYKKLVDIELEEKTAGDLIQKIYARFGEKEYNNMELVEKYLIEEITGMIPVAAPPRLSGKSKDPLVVLFAGPSGVGKTTCLAKLATNKRFFGECNVAMVTADTYRVAATQQLGTFSEIADIPLEIAHSPRDITRAVKRHQDKDVILVDTPGGSQFNDKMLSELKDFITAAAPDEVHLVLSVSAKPSDLKHTIRRFKAGKNMRLLLTKFDETLTFGSVVGVVRDAGIPLSYLTFGQEVPEDIEPANAGKIAKLVAGNVF